MRLPEFRENPDRCVYVTGTIGQELVDHLTPTINKFRLASPAPITVYIDSLGGLIVYARLLMNLLRAPTQDGIKCKVVTVATGVAASAAADLLVMGDYAIAYPHARVWFHGTRQQAGQPVTTEVATSLAESLRQTNEGFAFDLANAAWQRFFFRYLQVHPFFEQMRTTLKAPSWTDVECLAYSLTFRLATEFNIPISAIEKHGRLSQLTDYLSEQERRQKKAPRNEAHSQSRLLKWLIDFKLKEKRKEKNWLFSNTGLGELQQDFALFLDYQSGQHMKTLRDRVKSWGPVCLEATETEEYQQQPDDQKETWLVAKTEGKIKPLWQLLVSICRSLQLGEHVLPAEDAYWLGLIDEVVGVSLPNIRSFMEDKAEKEVAAATGPIALPATAPGS